MDGWCDVASNTLLLLAVARALQRQERREPDLGRPEEGGLRKNGGLFEEPKVKWNGLRLWLKDGVWRLALGEGEWRVWVGVGLLGAQAILSSVGWNTTTHQLSALLEAEEEVHYTTATLAVMYLWRLANPHMLEQLLLGALLVGRTRQWVEAASLVLFLPILALSLLSLAYTTYLRAKL